jgi:signal transduction histidine kinase
VVVFVDDEHGLFCSVKDDGCGFDPATTPEGVGLSRSIRGRIEEAGGRVEVAAASGSGTEVRLWLP